MAGDWPIAGPTRSMPAQCPRGLRRQPMDGVGALRGRQHDDAPGPLALSRFLARAIGARIYSRKIK